MTANAEMNGPEQEQGNIVETQLPQHVSEFIRITRAHDAAVKSKDKKQQEKTAEELTKFYGSLSQEQQEDVRDFVTQQLTGKTIDDERGKVHAGITRTMHWAPRVVKVAADVLPQLSYQTVRLVVSVAGLALVGIGHGAATTWKAIQKLKKLFGQAA